MINEYKSLLNLNKCKGEMIILGSLDEDGSSVIAIALGESLDAVEVALPVVPMMEIEVDKTGKPIKSKYCVDEFCTSPVIRLQKAQYATVGLIPNIFMESYTAYLVSSGKKKAPNLLTEESWEVYEESLREIAKAKLPPELKAPEVQPEVVQVDNQTLLEGFDLTGLDETTRMLICGSQSEKPN